MTKAFPGAYGWGANSIGGRGGAIYEVDNLKDSGSGSFRDAMMGTEPRIITFSVGGEIVLESGFDPLAVNSYVTVAGQTAPGGGIAIRGAAGFDGIIFTGGFHDLIMQYVRIRGKGERIGSDAVAAVLGSHDLIFDHCSFSWATNENAGVFFDCYNITLQWCLNYEGMWRTNISGGTLVGGGSHKVSIHHNLFANTDRRNPYMKGDFLKGNVGNYDLVNNVTYNWNRIGMAVGGESQANIISNRIIPGPESWKYANQNQAEIQVVGPSGMKIYAAGNTSPVNNDPGQDNWDVGMIGLEATGERLTKSSPEYSADPLSASPNPIPATDAATAYAEVLADAGCSKRLDENGSWVGVRDAADERIVAEVVAGTGGFIDNIDDVGGPPVIVPGIAYSDADSDGMPDAWELNEGLNPNDGSDGPLIGPSGYSNVELFLNGSQENQMSVITDLQAVEAALRTEAAAVVAQADAVAQSILDLQAVDDALDAAADVIEAD